MDLALIEPLATRGRADVWPLRDQHVLQQLDLTAVRDRQSPGLTGLADELAALADASWALDRESLAAISARRELNLAAAASFAMLARTVGGELGASLIERADAVARADWARNATQTVECDDHRVVVVYGPLKTWSTKDEGCRFSATVSVDNRDANALIQAVNEELPAAVSVVARQCDAGDVRFWHLPAFVVTDLVACGGEANTFPKHFAFFLPEDAGVRDESCGTKTVVFANVYEAQFTHIAAPVAERVLDPWRPIVGDAALRTLLVWFRGHDVGHFLGPHAGQVDYLKDVGRARGALQEAFADVTGYLLASSPGVLARAGIDGDDMAGVFLSEMLRYFRRGWQWFPDSCAARVELAYLVEGGWLRVGANDGVQLHWDADGLREGMLSLGRDLCAALLRGESTPLQRLVSLCDDDGPAWLGAWESRLLAETKAIGDALVYGFRG